MRVKIDGKEMFVDFYHEQHNNPFPYDEHGQKENRGSTICEISERGFKEPLFVGKSVCSSRDRFCKETGRKVALTRAIASLPRETRKQIWEDYFNRLPKPAALWHSRRHMWVDESRGQHLKCNFGKQADIK
jgi:hypothetical protein